MNFQSKNFDLPENVFFFYNSELQFLSFVLDWDTSDKFYDNLLNRFAANVIDEPDEYSMVLSKSETCTYFHPYIPAFDISYIEDCFNLNDYPDPNKYLIKNSTPHNYSRDDIFSCWFKKKKKWCDLAPATTKNKSLRISQRQIELLSNDHNTLSSDSDQESLSSKPPNKKTRLPYSYTEDMNIIKFILKYNGTHLVFGTSLWKKMERKEVNKIRTWQSMKERYIKYIKWHLKSGSQKFSFLNPNDLQNLQDGLKIPLHKR